VLRLLKSCGWSRLIYKLETNEIERCVRVALRLSKEDPNSEVVEHLMNSQYQFTSETPIPRQSSVKIQAYQTNSNSIIIITIITVNMINAIATASSKTKYSCLYDNKIYISNMFH